MRRSVRDFERASPMYEIGVGMIYAVEAMRPEQPVRYTQLPSYEMSLRRPCLDEGPEDHPTVLRKPRIQDGVSLCEPIYPDREW